MKILVGLVLLVATSAFAAGKAQDRAGGKKEAAAKSAADPNAGLAKDHGGKVWVTSESIPAVEGDALGSWLASHSGTAQLTQKPKEDRWPMNFVAVFKKAPAKGRVTVEFVDKEDPKNAVDQFSPDTPASSSVVYQEGYDLDANNGFNKGHTYVIRVGQLIKDKFVVYATGEIALK
jgi:hypothetical protein